MGISLTMIEKMQALGLFRTGPMAVLDVGSSNLYSASADGIGRFLQSYCVNPSPDRDAFAERLAKGSAYDEVTGGLNGAFAGELFEKAGIRYSAIDIADGYRTTILDLNHQSAPPHFIGAFDLVLNFGTTEHLLNQYNAFKVIHDSTKVGGYIVHSLPGVGYSNHGYFTYTPRCFFDMAGYNEYEVSAFWFEGPGGANDLYAPVRDYLSYFPNLAKTLADRDVTETGKKVAELNLPDVGIVIVYRKVKDKPFAGALERSTSVGDVPDSVTSNYEGAGIRAVARSVRANGPLGAVRSALRRIVGGRGDRAGVLPLTDPLPEHDEIALDGEAARLRTEFLAGRTNADKSMQFYHLVVGAYGRFPYAWERRILLLNLDREPDRADLRARLAVVEGFLAEGVGAGSGQ